MVFHVDMLLVVFIYIQRYFEPQGHFISWQDISNVIKRTYLFWSLHSCFLYIALKIVNESEHFRHVLLFYFRKDENAVQFTET